MTANDRLTNLTLLDTPERPTLVDEEDLVEDVRNALRPAQRVEQKMMEAMRTGTIFLSHLQQFTKPHGR